MIRWRNSFASFFFLSPYENSFCRFQWLFILFGKHWQIEFSVFSRWSPGNGAGSIVCTIFHHQFLCCVDLARCTRAFIANQTFKHATFRISFLRFAQIVSPAERTNHNFVDFFSHSNLHFEKYPLQTNLNEIVYCIIKLQVISLQKCWTYTCFYWNCRRLSFGLCGLANWFIYRSPSQHKSDLLRRFMRQ